MIRKITGAVTLLAIPAIAYYNANLVIFYLMLVVAGILIVDSKTHER